MYACVSMRVLVFHTCLFVCVFSDRGDDILKLASLNMERNSHLLQKGDVRVRELDWKAKALLEVVSEGECHQDTE